MKLTNLIFNKLINSSLITFSIIISIFFVMTLLGNLGESYEFKLILYLSLLSSIQICFYIPLFIFFLILSHFNFSLKTHNELTIIRHYIPAKKIVFIFSLLSLIFIILEINKEFINQKIENIKINFAKISPSFDKQIFIKHNGREDRDYILISDAHGQEKKMVKFEILHSHFNEAIYSSNFFSRDGDLIVKNYYKMSNDVISYHIDEKLILENIKDHSKEEINHIKEKQIIKISKIFPVIYLVPLFILIVLITMDKQYLYKSEKNIKKYLVVILLIFYSYIILNFNLSLYKIEFQLLSLMFVLLSISKKIFYEKYF